MATAESLRGPCKGRLLSALPPRRIGGVLFVSMSLGWSAAFAATDASTPGVREPLSASAGQVGLDPTNGNMHEILVAAGELCFALSLPAEWQLVGKGAGTRLLDKVSGAELEVTFRSAEELRGSSHRELAYRDAAALQSDYEALIGKPAQAVSVERLSLPGALRWSATWVDAQLPATSRSFTAETLIIPISAGWVVELTPNAGPRPIYEALISQVLSHWEFRGKGDCSRQAGPISK